MTVTHILIGVGAWTMVSLVAGLALGAMMRHTREQDELVASPAAAPVRLRRSA